MKRILTLLCTLLCMQLFAQSSIKGFGDSNTEFWVDLPKEQKWLYIIGKELNLTVYNYASAGSTIYSSLQPQLSKASEGGKDYVTFMYGTNDAYKGIITPQWKRDYKSYVEHFINEGYDRTKLIIISPNYDPEDVNGQVYLDAVKQAAQYSKEIAAELGIRYIPLYEEMKSAFEHPQKLSVYYKPVWMWVGSQHLNKYSHRMLADIIKKNLQPPVYIPGEQRVKLFGAGSAMAGISSYHHSFVQLFGNATNRHPVNYAVAGTGIQDLNMNEVNTGIKDIIILLYGNNDGYDTETWRDAYTTKVNEIKNAGYAPDRIVLMTVTIAPDMAMQDPHNYNRVLGANRRIREVAAATGVRLIDLEKMALSFADGWHIDDKGNEVVAEALKAMFSGTNTNACAVPPPAVISASGPTAFCQGGSVLLTSSVREGNQWYKDGVALNGATNATFLASVSGNYTTVINPGGCASAPSLPVAVTLLNTLIAPAITTSGAANLCNGSSVTLISSESAGNEWLKNGVIIPGANGGSYLATTAGSYSVRISNGTCVATSSAIEVTEQSVIPAPTVSIHVNSNFCSDGSVMLTSSSANGNQWYKDGMAIGGATNQTYTANSSGSYSVKVLQNNCGSEVSLPLNLTITSKSNACLGTGSVLREYWENMTSSSVSGIPVNTRPTSSTQLNSFESPSNVGDYYGQRVRGYLCVPVSGSYTFYIAGDDDNELWLSSSENPAAKEKIAFTTGWTESREWTKYASQKSATLTLQANMKYYIEALHRDGVGGDNLAVGWLPPGSSAIEVIPGSSLSPFIVAGSIQENLGAAANVSQLPVASRSIKSVTAEVENKRLSVKALPNPSAHYFTLISSSNSNKKLQLRVTDVLGKTVEVRSVGSNSSLRVGENYRPGIYLVEAVQGKEKVTLKLIKGSQ